MSIGRTKEEQELTSLLAKTVVQRQVMEPMAAHGWQQGTPPSPEQAAIIIAGRAKADGATDEQIAEFLKERGVTPPAGGLPATTEGAPGKVMAPAARPTSGQPAPAAGASPATAPTPKADAPTTLEEVMSAFESLRDPQTGLIVGKFKTFAEAVKGSGHLANMAKQSFQERDAALKQLREIQELGIRPQPVASPATAPAPVPSTLAASRVALEKAQATLDAVLSKVEEDGDVVNAETLRAHSKAQREVAELAAEVRMQEMQHRQQSAVDAEQNRWKAVDDFMQKNHPESLTRSAEIGLHIQSDPVLQEAVSALVAQGKEVQASVLAWRSYERAVNDGTTVKERAAAEEKEVDLAAKEQVRKELLEKARRDAGVIQGSAGGVGIHESPEAGAPSREELNAAVAQMRHEGEGLGMPAATRFRHLLIGRTLDPSIFGPR
jgi:hypothetical protein